MSSLKSRIDRLHAERARVAASEEHGAVLWLPDNDRGPSTGTRLYDPERRRAALDAGQDEASALELARLSH